MSSPFAVFRKHQKIMLVLLVGLSMLSFVIFDAVQNVGDIGSMPPTLVVLAMAALVGAVAWVIGIGNEKSSEYGSIGLIAGLAIGLLFVLQSRKSDSITAGGFDISRNEMISLANQRLLANQFVAQAIGKTAVDPNGQEADYKVRMNQFGFGFPEERQDEDLLLGELLRREADKLGLELPDSAVHEYIRKITDDRMTTEDFREIRQETGASEGEIVDSLKQELRARQTANLLYSRVDLPPAVDWEFSRQLQVRQSATTAAVPVSAFIDEQAAPPQAELDALFQEYRNNAPGMTPTGKPQEGRPGFYQAPRIRLAYVTPDYQAFEKQVEGDITETLVQERYQRDYVDAAKKPASSLPGLLPNGPTIPGLSIPGLPGPALTPLGTPPATPEPSAPAAAPPEPAAPAATPAAPAPAPAAPAPAPGTPSPAPATDPPPTPAADGKTADGTCGDEPAAPAADAPATPATSPTVAAAPASTTPVSPTPTPPSSDAAAATVPATTAPATPAPADAPANDDPFPVVPGSAETPPPTPPTPIPPLDDALKAEIREQLLAEKTAEAIERAMSEATEKIRNEIGRDVHLPPESPQRLTIDAATKQVQDYAAAHQFSYVQSELMTYQELLKSDDYPVAQFRHQNPGNPFQQYTVADELFSSSKDDFFRPRQIEDRDAGGKVRDRAIYWKLEHEAGYIPESMTDERVRDNVVKTWRELQARKKAEARARELAEQVRKSDKPMLVSLADTTVTGAAGSTLLSIMQTGQFAWMRQTIVPAMTLQGFDFAPVRSQIPGLEPVGDDFMRTVFSDLGPGDVGVAPSADRSVYYVVKIDTRIPSNEEEWNIVRNNFLSGDEDSALERLGGQLMSSEIPHWADELFRTYDVRLASREAE